MQRTFQIARRVLLRSLQSSLQSVFNSSIPLALHCLDPSSATPPLKFFLHVHSDILVHQWATEGKILASAVNVRAFQKPHAFSSAVEDLRGDDLVLTYFLRNWRPVISRKDISNHGVLVTCIYRRNCMFRMYWSTKEGKNPPLLPVSNIGIVETDVVSNRINEFEEKYEIVPHAESAVELRYSGTPCIFFCAKRAGYWTDG